MKGIINEPEVKLFFGRSRGAEWADLIYCLIRDSRFPDGLTSREEAALSELKAEVLRLLSVTSTELKENQ